MVLVNYSTRELTAKLVYYGPGLCGKTTNLQYIFDNLLPKDRRGKMVSLATETDRTLFFDFLPLEIGTIRGLKTRLQLYTVPGQVHYNATRKIVLKGADGIVFVADSQAEKREGNLESYNNMKSNLAEHGIDIRNVPLVFQFNKRDLPNCMPIEQMEADLNEQNVPFFEACAIQGIGVEDTLKGISKLVLKNLAGRFQSISEAGEAGGAAAGAAKPPAASAPAPTPLAAVPVTPQVAPPAAALPAPAAAPSAQSLELELDAGPLEGDDEVLELEEASVEGGAEAPFAHAGAPARAPASAAQGGGPFALEGGPFASPPASGPFGGGGGPFGGGPPSVPPDPEPPALEAALLSGDTVLSEGGGGFAVGPLGGDAMEAAFLSGDTVMSSEAFPTESTDDAPVLEEGRGAIALDASLDEGFGMPPGEDMEAALLSGDTVMSSLPEVPLPLSGDLEDALFGGPPAAAPPQAAPPPAPMPAAPSRPAPAAMPASPGFRPAPTPTAAPVSQPPAAAPMPSPIAAHAPAPVAAGVDVAASISLGRVDVGEVVVRTLRVPVEIQDARGTRTINLDVTLRFQITP